MGNADPPDYTNDWQRYWTYRYEHDLYRKLTKVAEKPATQYLPIEPSTLDISEDEYDWSIETPHLRDKPDAVLNDARKGFSKFVSEKEVGEGSENKYDFVPVNFTERFFDLVGHFRRISRWRNLNPNTVSSIGVDPISDPKRSTKPAVISYECPNGHVSRMLQNNYSRRNIQVCTDQGCTNSVYQISKGTIFRDLVEFEAIFDDVDLKCVADGKYVQNRIFNELKSGERPCNLVGILRNLIDADDQPIRVFQALHIDYQ